MQEKIRVRFAPSPTGPLHIGGVRTALYNYLFAKKNKGDLILRIEDTDQTRLVPGAEKYIIDALDWCGIKFDEGVHIGGPYAPYRQSERKNFYTLYAEQLVKNGYAYYAFDTAEELEVVRKEYESKKENFFYHSANRLHFKNSLSLSETDIQNRLISGEKYVIRIKIPENEQIIVHDLIRGKVVFDSTLLDDKVLYKSDGMPTYHLANVVDDYMMKITHVIRGEEWLPSTPLHVLLYRFLDWQDSMPCFAHLPLLLKPDGKGKLSKRDGDRLGFPVFPLNWNDITTGEISSGFRESGYFPEAFVNLLALLGWNPGTEKELFSMSELIDEFSLEKVGKSGSKFDPDKARWFNHQYILQKSPETLTDLFIPVLKEKKLLIDIPYIKKICSLMKERINFIHELWDKSSFFYIIPSDYDIKTISKNVNPSTIELLKCFTEFVDSSPEKTDIVTTFLETYNLEKAQLVPFLRIGIVGNSTGPDISAIINIIGKTETTKRITLFNDFLKNHFLP